MNTKSRYKYSPQLKTYDSLMNDWEPYTMFRQPNNIKSKVLNTDIIGTRYTKDNNFSYSLFDDKITNKHEQIAIFGGSTAFGVGSTQDSKTISSLVALNSKYKVYNLGFRAYNNFQELIFFNQIYNKFKNLKYVVFVSGFNDIFLSKMIHENISLVSSPFFLQSEFKERMNYPNNSFLKKILYNFLPLSKKSKINWVLDDNRKIFKKLFKNNNSTKVRNNYDWRKDYQKNFKIWNMLSEKLNFKMIFLLQPFINWVDKKLSKEETEILEELKMNNSEAVMNALISINKSEHQVASNFFMDICKKNNTEFIDLNKQIQESNFGNKWFFVDSIHLNDYGYEVVAKIIIENLND